MRAAEFCLAIGPKASPLSTCLCAPNDLHSFPMIWGAVTVIVVIAAGDPKDGSTEAIERALRAAVDERVVVVVRAAREGEADDPSRISGGDPKETLAGAITWGDRQRRVVLRFVQPNGRSSERELRFDATDAASERGRTVGFAVASMLPDDARAATSTPPSHPAPPPPSSSAVLEPRAPRGSSAAAEPPPTPPRDPRTVFALDLAASAAVGLGGYGGGVGGGLAGRIPLGAGFAARLGVSARLGEVAPAQATSRAFLGAAGLSWQTILGSRWGLGARADFLVMRQEISHLSADDPDPVSRARFVPGGGAFAEASARLIDHAWVILAIGPEIAFGKTTVVVAGREVGAVPPVRLAGETGVRVSF